MSSDETSRRMNMADENQQHAAANAASEELEPEEIGMGGWREAFRTAFDRAGDNRKRWRADRN